MKHILYISSTLLICTSLLASELAEPGMPSQQFERITAETQETLSSDVVSPAIIRKLVHDEELVEKTGAPIQKEEYRSLLQKHSQKLRDLIAQQMHMLLDKQAVKKLIMRIGIEAFKGALPAAVLQALIATTSGQGSQQQFTNAVLSGAVLGAIDNLMNSARSGALTKAVSGTTAKAVMQSAYYFIEQRASYPLGGIVAAGIKGAFIDGLNQMVAQAGGWNMILQNLEWKGVIEPAEEKTAVSPQKALFNALVSKMGTLTATQKKEKEKVQTLIGMFIDKISSFATDKTVHEYVAATTVSAMEGAAVGMLFSSIGLGYPGEVASLEYAALRGAFEGIFNFATYHDLDLGMLTQASTGILVRSVQKYLTTGTQLSVRDVPSSLLQSFGLSAVNQLVQKAGGWQDTMKSLIGSATKIRWYIPYRGTATKAAA